MNAVRDTVARFIEREGHRTELSPVDAVTGAAEVVFRTRGQIFSVTTFEGHSGRFSISTAYEVPDLIDGHARQLGSLGDIQAEYPATHFMLTQDDTVFVATIECEEDDVETFVTHFWAIVSKLREAGTAALERMVDRSESKAAADKFIAQFTDHGQ